MRLRIKNFKSYSDTGFVDLKPLTLIFGKNSAGKSAVIQALNAISSSPFFGSASGEMRLRRGKANLAFYGETWDLGDFDRVVHKRNKGSDIGFEFEVKFLGVDARSKLQNKPTKNLNSDKVHQRTLLDENGTTVSLNIDFTSPGVLSSFSIRSKEDIPISVFIEPHLASPRSMNFIPEDDPKVYGPMVLKLLRENNKAGELFIKTSHRLWLVSQNVPGLLNEPPSEVKSKYTKPSSIRWERHRIRREQDWANSLGDLTWLKKFDGPAEFLQNCSEKEFVKLISVGGLSNNPMMDRVNRQLIGSVIDTWALPKLNLILEPLPKEFNKVIQQHNQRAKRSSGFVIDKKISDVFIINHDFVLGCFSGLGDKNLSKYWIKKFEHLRLIAILSPAIFIYPVEVNNGLPKFLADEPIHEFLRGYYEDRYTALSFIPTIISTALNALSGELRGVKHLPAFRGNPRRTVDRDSRDEIAKSLGRLTNVEIKKLNSALKLIGWEQDFDLNIESESGENRKIPRLTGPEESQREKRKNFETLADVGFGFSQLLPIVENAICSTPSSFLVEEPEVHLHPSLQGDLIELIARNSLASADLPIEKVKSDHPLDNKHQWFIETHSEYMLRRVQKLIAKKVLDSEKVAVYFCDIDEHGERLIREIKLGSKGQMLVPWPNDFIETNLELNGLDLDVPESKHE